MKTIPTEEILNNIQSMLNELKLRVVDEDQVIKPKPRKSVHIDLPNNNVRHLAIIEAKELLKPIDDEIFITFNGWYVVPEFIINYEKKTIVALVKGPVTKILRGKGIAKCDPADVFNIHIGKAIALYRALGKKVPTILLTAPNPTVIEVGDIIGFKNDPGFEKTRYKVKSLDSKVYENLEIITRHDGASGNGDTAVGGNFDFAKIIDDSKNK
jgi:hypothetical protein